MNRSVILGLQVSRETLLVAEARAWEQVCRLRAELARAEQDFAAYRTAHENIMAALEDDLAPALEASLADLALKAKEDASGPMLCAGAFLMGEKK